MRLLLSCTALAGLCGALMGLCDSTFGIGVTDNRIQMTDLRYVGAFRLPASPPTGQTWQSSFSYGGGALAYNPQHNSLFMVGKVSDQLVAEVSIPTPVQSSSIAALPVAQVLQPFADVTGGLRQQYEQTTQTASSGGTRIGGMLVYGSRLVWTVYIYYDAGNKATVSHGYSSLDLSQPNAQGIYALAGIPPGAVAGYMAPVPADWQQSLGVPALTGQSGIPIASRTSVGPAAIGFDPQALGSSPAPASPFIYYPLSHPLAGPEATSQVWNAADQTTGMAFISTGGKASVMVFGRRGQGVYWYGPPEYNGITDTGQPYKGNHAPPYAACAWCYDPNDMISVKNGSLSTWQVRPYTIFNLPNMYSSASGSLGGAAYDAVSRRLYISQLYVDNTASTYSAMPVIHVFQVAPQLVPILGG